jgi:hypothetical protein
MDDLSDYLSEARLALWILIQTNKTLKYFWPRLAWNFLQYYTGLNWYGLHSSALILKREIQAEWGGH